MKINKGQFSLSSIDALKFSLLRGHGSLLRFIQNRITWHIYPKLHIVSRFPDHVDIELSTLCNMQCPMCYTRTEDFKNKVRQQFMSAKLYRKIVDECVRYNTYSIRLSLRGEPLIHPDIIEMIAYAKYKGICEISFLTNGLNLTPSLFKRLLEAGLTWMTVSIDGMDEVYESIRTPAKFYDILSKIKACYTIKRQHHSVHPVIKIQSIWPAIAKNPTRFYETFSPYVELIASNPLIDYLGKDAVSTIVYEKRFDCPVLYERLVIGSDGLILLCSNDELGNYILGNANTDDLHTIWHGKLLTEARKAHRNHRGYIDLEPCRHCYLPRATTIVNEHGIMVEKYVGRTDTIGE